MLAIKLNAQGQARFGVVPLRSREAAEPPARRELPGGSGRWQLRGWPNRYKIDIS